MIFTVEILNEHALKLLQELEQLKVIRLYRQAEDKKESKVKKEFKAITLDTRGYRFDRDEANER